jgi:UDP-3-O-[3-hydroxymyristoyl] glucosamine N-acyltransferase
MLGALVTTEALSEYFTDVIIHPNPKLAFIDIMDKFDEEELRDKPEGFIHERAIVDPEAKVAATAHIDAGAVIQPGAEIGEYTKVGAGTVVGRHTTVGDHCTLHANVTIYHGCTIGDRVIIHSGTVIGADGFGFVPTKDGHRKFRQVGTVVIEDDVEIGAGCCIDRGALDETIIHTGTKLDNLVQLAHGVSVGHHTVIAAQTGISGSTRIGSWCLIGGQAGFQGHITIGDQSIVAAQSGVFSDLPFKSKVSGYPAKPHGQSLKVLALTFKLPELVEKVKSLEIELDLMRGELKGKARREREKSSGSSKDIPPAGEA